MLRYVKKCLKKNSQNRQMSYFSPLCQLQLSLSQDRPVLLAPLFCWSTSHLSPNVVSCLKNIYLILEYTFKVANWKIVYWFAEIQTNRNISWRDLRLSSSQKHSLSPHHHSTNSSWLRWLPQMSRNQLVNIDEPHIIWYDLIFFPTYMLSWVELFV